MRVGYVKVTSREQVEGFSFVANVDHLFLDVVDKCTDETYGQLESMLGILCEGDEVVLLSLDNAFSDYNTIKLFFSTLISKGVELRLLAPFQGFDFNTPMTSCLNSITSLSLNTTGCKVTHNKYPENFYEVYTQYSNGDISCECACEMLEVSRAKFYSLLNLFERK